MRGYNTYYWLKWRQWREKHEGDIWKRTRRQAVAAITTSYTNRNQNAVPKYNADTILYSTLTRLITPSEGARLESAIFELREI